MPVILILSSTNIKSFTQDKSTSTSQLIKVNEEISKMIKIFEWNSDLYI